MLSWCTQIGRGDHGYGHSLGDDRPSRIGLCLQAQVEREQALVALLLLEICNCIPIVCPEPSCTPSAGGAGGLLWEHIYQGGDH